MTNTILVIDDDPDVLAGMVRLLRLHGYKVESAADGEAGLASLSGAAAPPALILLDLHMPRLDGRGFLLRLVGLVAYQFVPIVVASGADDVVDQLRGLPVDAIVRKPVRPTALVKLIEDLLARPPVARLLAVGSGPHPSPDEGDESDPA